MAAMRDNIANMSEGTNQLTAVSKTNCQLVPCSFLNMPLDF